MPASKDACEAETREHLAKSSINVSPLPPPLELIHVLQFKERVWPPLRGGAPRGKVKSQKVSKDK